MAHFGPSFFRNLVSPKPPHPNLSTDRLTKGGGYHSDGSYTNVFDAESTYDERDTLLEHKSRLYIRFPDTNDPNNKAQQIVIPFYEDPIIKESKRARYASYSPIGRASNLYTYLGSDSREFDLTFGLTLPHLIQMHTNNIQRSSLGIGSVIGAGMKERFFDSVGVAKEAPAPFKTPGGAAHTINYYNKIIGQWAGVLQNAGLSMKDNLNKSREFIKKASDEGKVIQGGGGILGGLLGTAGGALAKVATQGAKQWWVARNMEAASDHRAEAHQDLAFINDVLLQEKKGLPLSAKGLLSYIEKKQGTHYSNVKEIMDILVYWIEIIRATTYNDTFNPVFGPPIVVLEHGILYRRIPCIVESYNIEFDPRAGYEKDTLLPRKLLINMSLKENRAGNFGEFDSTQIYSMQGNNLAGYEVLFKEDGGSLDLLPEHRANK